MVDPDAGGLAGTAPADARRFAASPRRRQERQRRVGRDGSGVTNAGVTNGVGSTRGRRRRGFRSAPGPAPATASAGWSGSGLNAVARGLRRYRQQSGSARPPGAARAGGVAADCADAPGAAVLALRLDTARP